MPAPPTAVTHDHENAIGFSCHWPGCVRTRGGLVCWCSLHSDSIRAIPPRCSVWTRCYDLEWEKGK